MELKEGYKKTEIGIIPTEWNCLKILDLIENDYIDKPMDGNHGNIHPKKSDFVNDGIPFIMANNIIDGLLDLKNCNYIRQKQAENLLKGFAIAGDILLTHKGTVGNTAIVEKIFSPYLMLTPQVTYYRIKSSNYLDRQYLRYFFDGYAFQKILKNLSGGGTRSYIGITKQIELPIVLPATRNEQTAIGKALSDADAWIQSLIQLIAKKRQIKQGAMQTLLNPYENGKLKDGWEFIKFVDAFNFLSTASYSRAELNNNGELGYVHYGDIHTKWNEFLDFNHHLVPMIDLAKIKGYSLVKEGDLIMADVSEDFSGIGKSVEIKSLGNRQVISGLHTLLLRDKGGNFVNGFRGYIHKFKYVKEQFDSLATGLKVYGLSKGNLKDIEIPVPPKKEQVGIVSYFHDLESEIRLLEIKLAKAKQIKQGMMQNLLTGRIRLI